MRKCSKKQNHLFRFNAIVNNYLMIAKVLFFQIENTLD